VPTPKLQTQAAAEPSSPAPLWDRASVPADRISRSTRSSRSMSGRPKRRPPWRVRYRALSSHGSTRPSDHRERVCQLDVTSCWRRSPGTRSATGRALERALDLAEPDGALSLFLLHPAPGYSSTTRGTAPPTLPWSPRFRACSPGTSPLRRTLLVAW